MNNQIENKSRINLDAESTFIKKLIDDLNCGLLRLIDFFDQFPEEEKRNLLIEIENMKTNTDFIVRTLMKITSKSKQA